MEENHYVCPRLEKAYIINEAENKFWTIFLLTVFMAVLPDGGI
jgi:hypothetical protein